MVDALPSFEKILYMIDNAIKPAYLNKIQQIILKQTWEGKTYSEIASKYNYEFEYIKSAGCELWKLLSKSFNENITKINFVQFMRRKINSTLELRDEASIYLHSNDRARQSSQSPALTLDKKTQVKKLHNWNTAPDVSRIQKRSLDIDVLTRWSDEPNCHFILVSGMVGCGKTTLVTQFAQQEQDKYDYVVWLSLANAPKAEVIVKSCLQVFDSQLYSELLSSSADFCTLLTSLVSCLRKNRCLIVLDSLQSIIEIDSLSTYYRKGYEQYGNLLRSIIMTDNKSLLVCTSRTKPRWLSHYSCENVRSLTLNGLNKNHSIELVKNSFQKNRKEDELWDLLEYYMYNPQILKIIATKIRRFNEIDLEEFLIDAPIIEDVDFLLKSELEYLNFLEIEIIHWLAISCSDNTAKGLRQKISQPTSKGRFLEVLEDLEQRALIVKNDGEYVLAPLIKDYLQRQLVHHSLTNFERSHSFYGA